MLIWDNKWDDENELDQMSVREIYGIWRDVAYDKKLLLARYMEKRFNKVFNTDDFTDVNSDKWGEFDLVAATKIVYSAENVYMAHDGETKAAVSRVLQSAAQSVNGDNSISSLQKCLRLNAINSAVAVMNNQENDAKNGAFISRQLNEAKDITPQEIHDFNDADETGSLDNVDQEAIDNFREKIAALSRFAKVDAKTIVANDDALAKAFEEANQDELWEKIEVPLTFKGEVSEETAAEMQDQLRKNALLRATYDALADKEFLKKHANGLDIEETREYFKNKIAENYKRSLVLARIATDESAELLNKVVINRKTGEVTYDGSDENIIKIVDAVENKEPVEIDPLAVAMDKYDLDLETAAINQTLKSKRFERVADTSLGFMKKSRQAVKDAWKVLTTSEGWKKIGKVVSNAAPKAVANVLVIGGAAALMASGSGAVIAAGSGAYAVWTWANAKVIPVWEKMKKEGLSWKDAKAKLEAQTRWKERSNRRTAEGIIVGAVAGISGFLAGPLGSRYGRQGAMAVGKTAALVGSAKALKESKEEYLEAGHRSVTQYKKMQELKAQKKQDAITLGAVVGGSLIGNYIAAKHIGNSVEGSSKGASDPQVTGTMNNGADNDSTGSVVPEDSGTPEITGESSSSVDPNTLSTTDRASYNLVRKRWGEERLNTILSKMEHDGKIVDAHDRVFDMPEGMSKYQVAEAFYYLSHHNYNNQYAKILGYLFYNDCDGKDTLAQYTDAQVNEAINVLRAINLGQDRVIMVTADGCPSVYTHTHGSINLDKYHEITGTRLREEFHLTRTRVNYDPCDGTMKGYVTRLASPCSEEPQVEEVVTPPAVEYTPAPRQPMHFDASENTTNMRIETQMPASANELQIYTAKGGRLPILREDAVKSFARLHEDCADLLKPEGGITAENLRAVDKMLGINGHVVVNPENPEQSVIEYTGAWKAKGIEMDNTVAGTVRMTVQELREGLNGNYGDYMQSQPVSESTYNELMAHQNEIEYSETSSGRNYYSTPVAGAERLSDAVAARVDASQEATMIVTDDAGCCFGVKGANGEDIQIHLENGVTSVTDANDNPLTIDPRDRAGLAEQLNDMLAELPDNAARKMGTVNFNPPADSLQHVIESKTPAYSGGNSGIVAQAMSNAGKGR